MNTNTPQPWLNRRHALRWLALMGVTSVTAYSLLDLAPWLNPNAQSDALRQPIRDPAMPGAFLELVRYATLAANGHNAQPWKFVLEKDSIEIHPDETRRLVVVDPHERELWISLGCALENLLIAARATGYAPTVTYPDTTGLIRVHLRQGTVQTSPLFEAIPKRQTTRAVFDGSRTPSAVERLLQNVPLEPGIALRVLLDPKDLDTTLEYIVQGDQHQYGDPGFVAELIGWLRFNKREALATLDGLYSRCSGNPDVPRWLGQWFVRSSTPQQRADQDAKLWRSAAGALLISSDLDDRASWVRTGQVYERLALHLTVLNLKSAVANQPIEVVPLRHQFREAMGLESTLPQMLMRFGQAPPMPPSLRRPVAHVVTHT